MGEVFLADQLGPLGPVRPVALKRMHPTLAHDAVLARRFLQEMGIAARLNHSHIAVTHDFGEVEGVYFMAMEYIEGASLDRIIADGPLAVPSALLVARCIAEALAHAHDRPAPVVHQDVSPHNVMLGTQGQIKLLDFGIAAAEAASQEFLRAKAPYAAPEQLMGHPPERRFDLWALGVVLYEMLAGQRPFAGPGATDVLAQIKGGGILPIERLQPRAADVSPLIRRALDPVPERRWSSARAFAQACTTLLAGREGSAAQALILRIPAVPKHEADAGPPTATAAGVLEVDTPITGDTDRGVSPWRTWIWVLILLTGTGGSVWWASTAGPPVIYGPSTATRAWPSNGSGRPRPTIPAQKASSLSAAITESPSPAPHAAGPGAKPTAKTGRPKTGPAKTGRPKTGPAKTGRPKTGPAKTGRPKTGPAKTGALKAQQRKALKSKPSTRRANAVDAAATPEPGPQRSAQAQKILTTQRSKTKASRSKKRPVAQPPAPDRPGKVSSPPAAETQLGMLSVRSTPWARVELDGVPLGEGIIAARPVTVGPHRVRLIPGEGAYSPRTVRVQIEPGRVTKIFADFDEDRVRVRNND